MRFVSSFILWLLVVIFLPFWHLEPRFSNLSLNYFWGHPPYFGSNLGFSINRNLARMILLKFKKKVLSMCLPAITALLGNVSFGTVYYMVAPKFSFHSKILLKIQMKAFGLAAVCQGIFTSCYPPKKNEGFSKRKFFEVVTPYFLISGSMYFSHRQALKVNAVSTFVLGTAQLGIGQLAPKIVSYFKKKIFSPEEVAFGKAKWDQYFGDVGDVPPLPQCIADILNAPCPFYSEKQVRDTHMLVLIPKTVNNKPFTLNLLKELIEAHKEKKAFKIAYYSDFVKAELGETQPERAHWILMTKKVVPESLSKTYEEQKKLVQDKGAGDYNLPSAIEAAASILMHYFETNEVFYVQDLGTNVSTYTRCQETITRDNYSYPVAIGGYSRKGLIVTEGAFPPHCGAAAVREF